MGSLGVSHDGDREKVRVGMEDEPFWHGFCNHP